MENKRRKGFAASLLSRLDDEVKARRQRKISYSQMGEDLIVDFVLRGIGIAKPTYLDIGAHHPFYLSNTAIFYARGCSGINVEPDPELFRAFEAHRTRDVNVNAGIADRDGAMEYYVIAPPTLNTFDEASARGFVEQGHKIVCTKQIDTHTVRHIVERYAGGLFPDFLSLDAEGMEWVALKDIDYAGNAPKVICVETISYSKTGRGEKQRDVIDFLISKGYLEFADTYINSIFVRESLWRR